VTALSLLALLMAAPTYLARAAFLLAPGGARLRPSLERLLRLTAPAVLASLAAVNVATREAAGGVSVHVGPEWLGVAACALLVRRRRSLLVGLTAAVVLTAMLRALGFQGVDL
jgi:branched-subunit amino acid transport protein